MADGRIALDRAGLTAIAGFAYAPLLVVADFGALMALVSGWVAARLAGPLDTRRRSVLIGLTALALAALALQLALQDTIRVITELTE